jgi:SAM-dependent methyltransferase
VLHSLRVAAKRLFPGSTHGLAKAVVLRAAALALHGDGVECPCCRRRYRRFLQYPSLFCPGCSSFERHRFLCLYLGGHLELLAGRRSVLHVSPEPCIERLLRGHGFAEYLSIDLEYRLAMRKMDVTKLEFGDGSFDTVVCSHVLDAVADLPRALSELNRVLEPGGLALLTTPAIPRDTPERFAQSLREAGFDVEVLTAAEAVSDAEARRYGIDRAETLYAARRAA